jgi:hypothetical protein
MPSRITYAFQHCMFGLKLPDMKLLYRGIVQKGGGYQWRHTRANPIARVPGMGIGYLSSDCSGVGYNTLIVRDDETAVAELHWLGWGWLIVCRLAKRACNILLLSRHGLLKLAQVPVKRLEMSLENCITVRWDYCCGSDELINLWVSHSYYK